MDILKSKLGPSMREFFRKSALKQKPSGFVSRYVENDNAFENTLKQLGISDDLDGLSAPSVSDSPLPRELEVIPASQESHDDTFDPLTADKEDNLDYLNDLTIGNDSTDHNTHSHNYKGMAKSIRKMRKEEQEANEQRSYQTRKNFSLLIHSVEKEYHKRSWLGDTAASRSI